MNAATSVPSTELAVRFALTFLLAFAFGYARQRGHKPIGFGTFNFVATWRRLEYRLDRETGNVVGVFALQGSGERLEAMLARLGRLDGLSALDLV